MKPLRTWTAFLCIAAASGCGASSSSAPVSLERGAPGDEPTAEDTPTSVTTSEELRGPGCVNGDFLIRSDSAADVSTLYAELDGIHLTGSFLGEVLNERPFAMRVHTSSWPEGSYWLSLVQPVGSVAGWSARYLINVDRTPPELVPERTTALLTDARGRFHLGLDTSTGRATPPAIELTVDGVPVPVNRARIPLTSQLDEAPDLYRYAPYAELAPGSVVRARFLEPVEDCAGNRLEQTSFEFQVPPCRWAPAGWTAEDCTYRRAASENAAFDAHELIGRGDGDSLVRVAVTSDYATIDPVSVRPQTVVRVRSHQGQWTEVARSTWEASRIDAAGASGIWLSGHPYLRIDPQGGVSIMGDVRAVIDAGAAGMVGVVSTWNGPRFARWDGAQFQPITAPFGGGSQSRAVLLARSERAGVLFAAHQNSDSGVHAVLFDGAQVTPIPDPPISFVDGASAGVAPDGAPMLTYWGKLFRFDGISWSLVNGTACGTSSSCKVRRLLNVDWALFAEVETETGVELSKWDGGRFIDASPSLPHADDAPFMILAGRVYALMDDRLYSAPLK